MSRVPPDAGRRMLQGRDRRRASDRVGAVQRAQAVQRPEGMDRRRDSGRWRRATRSCDERDQVGHDVRLAALDEQPLGVQPPEHGCRS